MENSKEPLKLVVFISGTGSNLKALVHAIESNQCHATIQAVISDNPSAEGLSFANGKKIPTQVVALRSHEHRNAWNEELIKAVAPFTPDLIVLAGFMRILAPSFLNAMHCPIINVHPSLLPAFPGAHGPRDAIAANVRISGCTVHLVDDGLDSGPILAQCAVPVDPDDDVRSLHQRIQKGEHTLLPQVVDWIAKEHITFSSSTSNSPVPSFHQALSTEGHLLFSPQLPVQDSPQAPRDSS